MDNRKETYFIVSDENWVIVMSKVNTLLDDGYKLRGDLIVRLISSGSHLSNIHKLYTQVLVKERQS